MTAKEYLSQVLYIDQRINCKLEQVMRLRENATKATATLSDMPHSDSPNLKSMENTISLCSGDLWRDRRKRRRPPDDHARNAHRLLCLSIRAELPPS